MRPADPAATMAGDEFPRHLHTFLPLSGASHMAKENVVAENLLRLELRFLRDVLGPAD